MKNEQLIIRFNLGIIISTALVLVAFEWKTYYFTFKEVPGEEETYTEITEDYIPLKIEQPKKPEPIKVKDIHEIKIVEVLAEQVTADPLPDQKVDEGAPAKVVFPDEEIPDENLPVYVSPEVNAEYPGGYKALYEYIYSKVKYPEDCREAGIQGTVHVSFVIGVKGNVEDIEIKRGVSGCKELERQVIKALEAMPLWKPGKQGGRNVRVVHSLPVKFVLQG